MRKLGGELADSGTIEGEENTKPNTTHSKTLEERVLPETLETLHSLLIECVPNVADALADGLVVDEEMTTRPEMTIEALRALLHAQYRWALDIDMSAPGARRYVWYKSANAEEPRRGPADEILWAFNLGLDVPQLAQALDNALDGFADRASVARLKLARPDLRGIVARIQTLADSRHHTPMMNIMGDGFVPFVFVWLLFVVFFGFVLLGVVFFVFFVWVFEKERKK